MHLSREAHPDDSRAQMDNKVKNIRNDLDSNKAELEELKSERKRIRSVSSLRGRSGR